MVAESIDHMSRKLVSFHFALHHIDSARCLAVLWGNCLQCQARSRLGVGGAGGGLLLFAVSSERTAFAEGDWAHLQPGQKGPMEVGVLSRHYVETPYPSALELQTS